MEEGKRGEQVRFCNWCREPRLPCPGCHPRGQCRHDACVICWPSAKSAKDYSDLRAAGYDAFPHLSAAAERLRGAGWEVLYQPLIGFPPYHWRGPDGMSGSEFRSWHPDLPPQAVLDQQPVKKWSRRDTAIVMLSNWIKGPLPDGLVDDVLSFAGIDDAEGK